MLATYHRRYIGFGIPGLLLTIVGKAGITPTSYSVDSEVLMLGMACYVPGLVLLGAAFFNDLKGKGRHGGWAVLLTALSTLGFVGLLCACVASSAIPDRFKKPVRDRFEIPPALRAAVKQALKQESDGKLQEAVQTYHQIIRDGQSVVEAMRKYAEDPVNGFTAAMKRSVNKPISDSEAVVRTAQTSIEVIKTR